MKQKSRGIALISALVFILILMISSAWLAVQLRGNLQITHSIKKYEILFSLADGILTKTIDLIKKHILLPENWDPRVEHEITNNLPAYLNGTWEGAILKGRIIYKGYTSQPPPGFMLNNQGYASFHQLFYKGIGQAEEAEAKSQVAAYYIKVNK